MDTFLVRNFRTKIARLALDQAQNYANSQELWSDMCHVQNVVFFHFDCNLVCVISTDAGV